MSDDLMTSSMDESSLSDSKKRPSIMEPRLPQKNYHDSGNTGVDNQESCTKDCRENSDDKLKILIEENTTMCDDREKGTNGSSSNDTQNNPSKSSFLHPHY